ncbi:hypothetical protein [Methanosarcina sp.]|uniref:COG1470 family protein n=1 Tax=Methanosarcina sp. TaxID=2213 RepID=UPI002988B057|nr:hypothetical protein [Methanosarcina sp.]MDW5549626.1 hypothetical protein [Methanosarcina sp.]MDW5552973.1 hypothetical protein [Methanosarcina sp.]MDW5558013.1 hypothetical protein [Methanosarcina sp.]
MKIKILILIVPLIISLQAASVYGMGVGVSPGNMSFKLAPGTSSEQPLYVINTGNETAKYNVFVNESAYQNWFTFSPSSFDLKAGEVKEVKVTLKVPDSAETDVKCKINIPCTVPGRIVGAGIIIPVYVELSTLEDSSSERVSSESSSPKGMSSGDSSSEVVSSDSNSSKGTENSSNPINKIEVKEALKRSVEKNIDNRLNFTQNVTHIDEKLKDYAQKRNFTNPLTEIKVKEILQQFLVKNINVVFNFMQNITHICEKLKEYAENLQVIGVGILDNATRSIDGTTKVLAI